MLHWVPKSKTNSNQKRSKALKPKRNVQQRRRTPKVSATNDGWKVHHSEIIDQFSHDGAFAIALKGNGYALNAGSTFTFPWLAPIARRFEQYAFDSITIRVRSSNPVTHGGRVYLMVDKDTTDPPPTAVRGFLNSELNSSSLPYTDCVLNLGPAECKRLHGNYPRAFVKEMDGADADPRSSTVGRFFVGVATAQRSDFTLEISYKVRLFSPQYRDDLIEFNNNLSPAMDLTGVGQTTVPFVTPTGAAGKLIKSIGDYAGMPNVAGIDVRNAQGVLEAIAGIQDTTETLPLGSIASNVQWDLLDDAKNRLALINAEQMYPFKPEAGRSQSYNVFTDPAAGPVGEGWTASFNLSALRQTYRTIAYLVPIVLTAIGARKAGQRPFLRSKAEL